MTLVKIIQDYKGHKSQLGEHVLVRENNKSRFVQIDRPGSLVHCSLIEFPKTTNKARIDRNCVYEICI